MTLRTRLGAVLAAALCSFFLATSAQAAPIITVTPNPIVGAPGDAIDVEFSIFNDNQLTPITLLGVTAQSDPLVGELDTFLGNAFDVVIDAQTTASGLIGTFTFAPAASGSTSLVLVFSFLGGIPTSPAGNFTEVLEYGVRVNNSTQPPVPEPATLALLGLGVAGAIGARRRRR